VYRVWRYTVLEQILKLDEISKMITFCEFLVKRQLCLMTEYKESFTNIYDREALSYLREES
jgi:hypothetical protein